MTDQEIVDCLARHGIGWGDESGVTAYPLDGEDAPIYIAAIRELLAAAAPVAVKQFLDVLDASPGPTVQFNKDAPVINGLRNLAAAAPVAAQTEPSDTLVAFPEMWRITSSDGGLVDVVTRTAATRYEKHGYTATKIKDE